MASLNPVPSIQSIPGGILPQSAPNTIYLKGANNPTIIKIIENNIVVGLKNGDLVIFNSETGVFLKTLSGHKSRICSLEGDKQIIMSGSQDNAVCIWNAKTGEFINASPATKKGYKEADEKELIHDIKSPCYRNVHVAVTEKALVAASQEGNVQIWDRTGKHIVHQFVLQKKIEGKGDFKQQQIYCMAHNDSEVAFGISSGLIMMNTDSGELIFGADGERAYSIAMDEKHVVIGDKTGGICFFDFSIKGKFTRYVQQIARYSSITHLDLSYPYIGVGHSTGVSRRIEIIKDDKGLFSFNPTKIPAKTWGIPLINVKIDPKYIAVAGATGTLSVRKHTDMTKPLVKRTGTLQEGVEAHKTKVSSSDLVAFEMTAGKIYELRRNGTLTITDLDKMTNEGAEKTAKERAEKEKVAEPVEKKERKESKEQKDPV